MAAIAQLDLIDSPDGSTDHVDSDTSSQVNAQVDAAADLMRRFVTSLKPAGLDAPAALALLGALTRLRNSVDAATALVAGRVEACHGHETTGHRSTAHYLAEAAGTTITRANELVETGKRVTDHSATDAALRSGVVSVEQACAVTSAAAVDPDAEADLLARAQTEGVKRLADRARSIRLAAETDRLGRYRRQCAARSLKHWIADDGMVAGRFQLPPDTGAAVVSALEREADCIFREQRSSGDHEAHDRYLADALTSLLHSDATQPTSSQDSSRGRSSGSSRGRQTDVVVHVSYEALVRGSVETSKEHAETCMIQGVGPIPVDVARDIAEDAFLTGVLIEGTDVSKIKRFGRRRSAELRTALEVREVLRNGDVRCTIDSCDATLGIEWDHRNPVARGGPTTYDNLQPLCRHHHRRKTAGDAQPGTQKAGVSTAANSADRGPP